MSNPNLPPKKWLEENLEKDRQFLNWFGVKTHVIDDTENSRIKLVADFSNIKHDRKTIYFGYNKGKQDDE